MAKSIRGSIPLRMISSSRASRHRHWNGHTWDAGWNAVCLVHADDEITAHRIGERRSVLEEFLLLRIFPSIQIPLVIESLALGDSLSHRLFEIGERDLLKRPIEHRTTSFQSPV